LTATTGEATRQNRLPSTHGSGSRAPKWGWTHDLRAGVEVAYNDGNPVRRGALGSVRRRSPWQRMAGPLLRRG